MRRLLYIDASGGASADMLLAGLLDLGLPVREVERAASRLVRGHVRIRSRPIQRQGMGGLRLSFDARLQRPLPRDADAVVRAVEQSRLRVALRRRIARVWRVLAAAEGRVHGVGWRRVRFHEVGKADTWVCFAGFCAGLAYFRVRQLFVGPVRLGSFHRDHDGRARRAPGPATCHLLKGFRVARTGDAFEWTTPTGAALLASLGSPAAPPALRVLRIGHGFGHLGAPAGASGGATTRFCAAAGASGSATTRPGSAAGGGVVRLILGELIDSR